MNAGVPASARCCRARTYDHDANGSTTGIAFPTGTGTSDEFAYDHAGRMTSSGTAHSGTPTATLEYERDPAGALTALTQDGLPGDNQTYGYDALDQLCYAAPSGSGTCDQPPTDATAFSYDAADNLTAGPTAANQRFNTANQLCWTSPTPATGTCGAPPTGATIYGYDTRGNRTATTPAAGNPTTYAYDQANRLTATTGAVASTYTYNGDGLRTTSTIEGATSQFTWSHAGGLPLVLKDGTNAYVYGPDGLPLAHQKTATGDVAYYHHDQLGSTRLLTADDGATLGTATYDPFGTLAGSTGQVSRLGFAGQYTDPHTGLQYLRARYYDPTTGQFLTRDPLEALTGEAYGYGSNDPINNTDPTGLCPWCVTALVGAVVGAAIDLGTQMVGNALNGCSLTDNINWGSVGTSALVGGLTAGGLGAVAGSLRATTLLGKTASSADEAMSGGRYLFNTWHRGTFPNRTQSVTYHLAKHGNGRTASQYTRDAMGFYDTNKSLGVPVNLRDGTAGIKIRTQSAGGYWTGLGKLVTFWD